MREDRARLIACFAAVFPTLSMEEIGAARPERVAAWDSVAHVTLLVVVEQEFGIQVAPEDIEHLTTFDAVLEYVERTAGPTSQSRVA